MEFRYINVEGYWEVYVDGEFYCIANTLLEAVKIVYNEISMIKVEETIYDKT